MLGFSYEYSKKWLFDALLQQGNAQPELKAGYNINSPLSVPYFRLSVGYNFTLYLFSSNYMSCTRPVRDIFW
jgi:hypothetical protein